MKVAEPSTTSTDARAGSRSRQSVPSATSNITLPVVAGGPKRVTVAVAVIALPTVVAFGETTRVTVVYGSAATASPGTPRVGSKATRKLRTSKRTDRIRTSDSRWDKGPNNRTLCGRRTPFSDFARTRNEGPLSGRHQRDNAIRLSLTRRRSGRARRRSGPGYFFFARNAVIASRASSEANSSGAQRGHLGAPRVDAGDQVGVEDPLRLAQPLGGAGGQRGAHLGDLARRARRRARPSSPVRTPRRRCR